ncbi:U4/U6.U5 tri-snRNP-associated protein 2 [Chionoecetes opilio]|uniref:ubiquitinyl hydrolase 1 n=1 Tax=Chionoecetes opilio TaxID=41210 RepID=A0A8J5BWL6_CHIOP|nr:U4/U6.U5 tri-snRNP-associated protein 2 [Chionoecetes opilio]
METSKAAVHSPPRKKIKRQLEGGEAPRGNKKKSRLCPYLDTINRHMLDFDFEKLCSVSLSRINVYACLVCGKYFQGRGPNTHAYTHSVSDPHHVFLNLQTLRFYCLPDNYEIIDSSLSDIIFVVNPTFTRDYILMKVNQSKMSRAYDGTLYLPGIVGLNNIKANDYCNVVLQKLLPGPEQLQPHPPRPGHQGLAMFPLITRFGELVRKLWNPRNFKAHVSPHEMLQAVVSCSKKKFQFTVQGDAIQILSWVLNSMHLGLKTPKRKSTIINRCFRGTMCITAQKRFTKNTFYIEKNPTIVNFPVKNIDLSEYLTEEVRHRHPEPIYDLVANIVHDGKPESGTYRCHILHKGTGKWYELQDLHVKEIEPQMLTLTESYIQPLKYPQGLPNTAPNNQGPPNTPAPNTRRNPATNKIQGTFSRESLSS